MLTPTVAAPPLPLRCSHIQGKAAVYKTGMASKEALWWKALLTEVKQLFGVETRLNRRKGQVKEIRASSTETLPVMTTEWAVGAHDERGMRRIKASVGDQIRFSVSREINKTIFCRLFFLNKIKFQWKSFALCWFYPFVSWIMLYFNMNDIINVYYTDMLIWSILPFKGHCIKIVPTNSYFSCLWGH